MPVLTLKFADETQNISFGVIDPAGLIFVAKDVETLKKMDNSDFFDMQIRQLHSDEMVNVNPERTETQK